MKNIKLSAEELIFSLKEVDSKEQVILKEINTKEYTKGLTLPGDNIIKITYFPVDKTIKVYIDSKVVYEGKDLIKAVECYNNL